MAFYQSKAYKMPHSSKRQKTMPRAETSVTGEASTTFPALRPCPALSAVLPHTPSVRGAFQGIRGSRCLPGVGRSVPRHLARASQPGSALQPPAHPETFPGSLRTLLLPAGRKRAPSPSVQRGRGGGQPVPPSSPRPGSPARGSLAEAPALHLRAVPGLGAAHPRPADLPRARPAV